MTQLVDFFFSPYASAQKRRLKASIEDGLAHGSQIQPLDPQPGQAVTISLFANAAKAIERVAVYYTTDGTEPEGEGGVATRGSVLCAELLEQQSYNAETGHTTRVWQARIPAQEDGTLVRYRADGWSPSLHWYADRVDPVTVSQKKGRCFAYHVDYWEAPAWWHDAVVYQIFVDRFNAAHDEAPLHSEETRGITDFFGGTLRGIIEKLDYIQSLGINCLWLSPLFESPSHHGYNPSDYHHVAQRYGTDEILQQLIQEAHRRDMHVLLDFVANHTSDEHFAFVDAHKNPDSLYAQWYDFTEIDAPHTYRSYAQVHTMPELSTDEPQVREYLYGAARYWLEHYGADGLRLDYVPGPSHAFWTSFQQTVKAVSSEVLTIGEISSPMPEIVDYAGRMDGFMDFPLSAMLRRTFGMRTNTLQELLNFLDTHSQEIPASMISAVVVDNHDMHRFLWLADGQRERLKLATAFQMTLEGTPIVYYGTEVGLSQTDDAHKENAYCRAPMLWGEQQDQDMLAYYRRLISLRHQHRVLRSGKRQQVFVENVENNEDKEQIGAYIRYTDETYALVVLNNSEKPAHVRIQIHELLQKIGYAGGQASTHLYKALSDVENCELPVKDGCIELSLLPLSAEICISQN
ncbi:glycoside hydrolase family 13 protein [Dictyobacter kobayashii]|uniref:Alpha-amylase n=1 Tax=Dictyobacter kobayashii TaxID=2014872 RepID=A0A402AJB5_9CHLR|nr:glycoside hydrolase family 13 protein [Dictyobacter kobayashii]GCE19163.1 alpha-amylase [Dictyobacter kobayashii]